MSDQERTGAGQSATRLNCPACGHLYSVGNRFCAECGAALPAASDETALAWNPSLPAPARPLVAEPVTGVAAIPEAAAEPDGGFWVLGAAPTSVIGGGILLLILAAVLLFAGQMDKTGTIVMLSICVTPIALLVLLVGIVRTVAGAARRG